MSAPHFSIVIPAFNAERTLADCIAQVQAEGFDDYELIIVDDGSTDRTPEIANGLAASDARIRVVRHADGANRGVAASRNLALEVARGDWIWYLDADDQAAPGALRRIARATEAPGVDVVTFNAVETGGGLPDKPLYSRAKPTAPVAGQDWVALWCRQAECRQYAWLRVCRSGLLRERNIRFPEGLLHEDIPWATEVDLAARQVLYLDAVLYHWIRNPASLTRTPTDAALARRAFDMVEILGHLCEIPARHPMARATRALLGDEIVGQGMQMLQLRKALRDPALRAALDRRIEQAQTWQRLAHQASSWRRKRHVAIRLLRQRLGWHG